MKPHEFIESFHKCSVESFHRINKCNDYTTKVSRSASSCSFKGKMQNKKRILSC